MSTPDASVATAEQALRDLIVHVLRRELGEDWLDKAVAAERREEWSKIRLDEASKRPGHTLGGVTDLSYAYLGHLCEIIESGRWWRYFEPALGQKPEISALFRILARVRRPSAHSRPLLPFEEDLASGIAGYLRNRVTIYLSEQDPDGDYYPRIERIADSLGNVWELGPQGDTSDGSPIVHTGTRLRVGEVITFRCRGFDPGNRELTWRLVSGPQGRARISGDEVEMTWTVEASDTGRRHLIRIAMSHVGPYHRNVGGFQGVDAQVFFSYEVSPPIS